MKIEIKNWKVYAACVLSAMLCVSMNGCSDDDESDFTEMVPGDEGNEMPDNGGQTDEPGGNTPDLSGHAAVDLGLSSGTLWATMNLGAEAESDYGKQYSWGEVLEKDVYDITTYKYCRQSYTSLTKYCLDMNYGVVDNRTVLASEDDAAQMVWGGSWRMPTRMEVQELLDECTNVWTQQSGIGGRLFTGPNGNTVFFPACGYRYTRMREELGTEGYYWSGTLYSSFSGSAYSLHFNEDEAACASYDRFVGFSVRPVVRR